MIPLLTVQAVERKCNFDHVALLGNYELCYSLGIISKAAGLSLEDNFDNVGVLKKKIEQSIGDFNPTDVSMQRLVRVVKEMDGYTDDYDSQMYELYEMGYRRGAV